MENIGRYPIVRELGRGAMGIVYLAQHPSMDRMVAIKTFRAPEGDEADMQNRDRLLAEADRAGSLDHPNIVKVYDVDERAEPPYIVMEYVDGPTLDQLLTTDPPDSDLSISILRQAAEALDYAHNQGVIHRDIKPANLMLDSKNTVKITDFGIAKRAGMNTQTTSRFMGTPDYMSPEQLDGRPDIDGRADQFALATIAYKLVTGRKPFEADTVTALSHLIATKNPVQPSQINRNLSKQVDAVISKALSKSRDRRYASCTEFTDALELALMAPARRAVPVWVPIAAAVVLLGALVGAAKVFGLFGTENPPIVMTVNPASAELRPSQTQQFKVSAGSASPDVRWTISPEVGTVSESGIYKAPSNSVKEQSVTLTATNMADKSVQAVADIKLLPSIPKQADVVPEPPPPVRVEHPRKPIVAPPPVAVPPAFALRVFARNKPVKPGASVDPGDVDFWMGDLVCHVVASGDIPRAAKLRLVWFRDGEQTDVTEFKAPGATGVRVPYENKPEPGQYRVTLLVNDKPVHAEMSFSLRAGKL